VVDKNGNLGIGTTSPRTLLHLFGPNTAPLRLENSTGAGNFKASIDFYGNGVGKWNLGNDISGNGGQNFFLYDIVAGKTRLYVDPNGNVGIGTTTPSHLIQLAGGAYCTGTGAWIAGSSVRWKENITPLTGGVDTLKELHPVSYNRKETPSKMTMGFIAEEVGKVLPSIVDWDKAEPGYAEGYDHLAILALTVQAIKEQQATMQELHARFKNENEKLQERIASLERAVNQFAAN
jgi:hypothetical protein